MNEKSFPILPSCSDAEKELRVPWAMILEHERQADRNHGQTLHRLAERGGCCSSEIFAILMNRAWRSMPVDEAIGRVAALIDMWNNSTCQLCGEKGRVVKSDYLPEEFEGVACKACCDFHEDEFERQQRIDDEMCSL